jgi:glycosyltransferase involved in cell wall biosynthesis
MDRGYRNHRLLWSLLAPLRFERPGGYQYSRTAIERMWALVPPHLRHGEIISHFQLFPPLHRVRTAGMQHSFYIDATIRTDMKWLWEPAAGWGAKPPTIGRRTIADALQREGELYRSARFCVTMARATARSLIDDYGVDQSKVFVVRPGVNMDESIVRQYLDRRGQAWRERSPEFTAANPARLGFVGKDYQRKGLPRLVEAAEILHSRGRPVLVNIIGHCPEHLRNHPRVELAGFISKDREMEKFCETVDRFAIGCLPSYAEPLGIGTLECLRLGVPVMGTNVGGIPDCISPQSGFLVPVDATGADIADAIEHHVFDADRYAAMVRGAGAEAAQVTWECAVKQLQGIWAGRAQPFQP